MLQITHGRLKELLATLSEAPELDLERHCLLVLECGGNPRGFYGELPLGSWASVLCVFSPLLFPLSLIPSHYGLIGVREPRELNRVFHLVATQNQTHVIYAPHEFQAKYVERLKDLPRIISTRSRLGASEYSDLLGSCGDEFFVLEVELSYDEPLIEIRRGAGLHPALSECLEVTQ